MKTATQLQPTDVHITGVSEAIVSAVLNLAHVVDRSGEGPTHLTLTPVKDGFLVVGVALPSIGLGLSATVHPRNWHLARGCGGTH